MSALRELLAVFDVDTASATTKLKTLDLGIGQAKASLATLAETVLGAFSVHEIGAFIKEQIEVGSVINDTAERLGVTTEALQKFQLAAQVSGVGAEAAAHALGFLNKNLGEAIGGNEEAAKTFAKLGINLAEVQNGSKDATDLLPQLADKFANIGSDAEKTAMAMSIFGRSGASLLPLLKQGSGELAKLSAEFYELGGGMNTDFIHAADKAGDEIDKLKFAMQGLKSRIAAEVLPTITEFATKLSHAVAWVRNLAKETYVIQEVLGTMGVVGAVAAAKTALGWAKVFGLFKSGTGGLLKSLASMGYLGVIIGLVAGLGLVVEDLWVGMNGGESAIRNWLNEANGVESTNTLFNNLKATTEQIKASFENLKAPVGSVVAQLGKLVLSPSFISAVEYVFRLTGSIAALLVGAARAAGNVITGDFKGAGKAIDEAGDAVFSKTGFFGSDAFAPQIAPSAFPAPKFEGPSYADPNSKDYQWGNGNAPPSVEQTNNTTVTVNMTGAPGITDRDVAAAVRKELAAANQNGLAALRRGPVK